MTYLGIDLGTSSVKVVLVDDNGAFINEATQAYTTQHPSKGAAEQNPTHWWDGTGRAVQSLPVHLRGRVKGIGLSGQMHGTVCLNSALAVIRPAIIWSDTRGAGTSAALTDSIGAVALAGNAGTALAPGFQAVTAAWLRQFEPQTWNQIETVLLPKDYLQLRLTGVLASEPSDAASTGLLDVTTRAWSDFMIEAVGLRASQLAPIHRSAEIVGALTPAAATHLGLTAGIPVVAGGGDAPLAAVAAGAASGHSILATLSSGAQVMAFLEAPVVDPGLRVHAFASPLDPEQGDRGWYVMGATLVCGMALHWLRTNVYQTGDDQSVEVMIRNAAHAPVGAGGLIFAPYLLGERTPHFDSTARAVFVGLSADHDRRHLTRAVLEGAVFAMRDALDIVRGLAPEADHVVLAGGGARSKVWRQIVADVFDMPVRPSRVVNQSAVGAAILAASAHLGEPAGTLAERWARFDQTVEPIAQNVKRYEALRSIFRDIYPAHAKHFQQLAKLT